MQPENWIPEKDRPSFFTTDLPENSRTFMLQVQKQPDGQVCGSIHNLYLEQVQPFCGLAEAILQMDAMMDALDCPQTSAEHRSFQLPNRELKNDMAAQRAVYYQWLQRGTRASERLPFAVCWSCCICCVRRWRGNRQKLDKGKQILFGREIRCIIKYGKKR